MSVFQAMSLEGWVDQMYMLQTTDPVAATAFYVLIVVLGSSCTSNRYVTRCIDTTQWLMT